MKPISIRSFCAVFLCLLCNVSQAAITFNFTYADLGTGFGFDDATDGLARRNTVAAVGAYINTVVNHNGTIDFHFNTSFNQPGASTLASAGSFFFQSPGFDNGLVFEHATTGVDPAPGFSDGTGQVNFGRSWYAGTGSPASNQFDLFSVVLHEVTHAMGFLSLVAQNGISEIFGGNPLGANGAFSVFDSLLERGNGSRLFTSTGPGNATFVGTPADLVSNDLFFAGANAIAANGGNRVRMYAPATYEPGSSVSHFDFSVGNSVMVPGISSGVQKREFSALDRAVLADLGWTLHATAVPEPSTYVLLLLAGGIYWFAPLRKRTLAMNAPQHE